MAWNEPGDSGNKDPWGSRKDKDQGPPDLDEVLRKLQQAFGGLFGGKRGGNGSNTGADNKSTGPSLVVVAVVVLVVWVLLGLYKIDEAEQGVVLRFGKYQATTSPGLNWHLPYPIETVEKVNITRVDNIEVGFRTVNETIQPQPREALMLTRDENIVDIKVAVQYRIKDARDYLFNVIDPKATVTQVTESAVREAVSKNDIDFVLTEGREEIATYTEQLVQQILDRYKAGLEITQVNLQNAQPPEEVQDAYQDAIRAISDADRFINEAETYANGVIPAARGEAARITAEANGYKEKVIARSKGETSRFLQVLEEYKKAPAVTRERLYIEAMEAVMASTNKIMVDVEGGNNLIYLPLDRLGQQQNQPGKDAASAAGSGASENTAPATTEQKNDLRERGRTRGEP